MTNIIYVRPIYIDEPSVEGSENGDGSGADVAVSTETINGMEAKLALLLAAIKVNCFGFSESTIVAAEEKVEDIQLADVTDHHDVHNRENHKDTHTYPRRLNPRLISNNPPNNLHNGEQVAAGWPSWLSSVAPDAIKDWIPRQANSFERICKIGERARSQVYKARDTLTGKLVALKKVQFNHLEPESVRIMAREILILRRLDHPNVLKLEGLVISKKSCSLYLVFEYMEHEFADLIEIHREIKFTEPQVKCYIHQLLSGLDHCHSRGILHSDINRSILLLNNEGILKIGGFGSASFITPDHNGPVSSWMVSLWYRAPELLLGATDYGVGVDLWSTGCILAELFAGKPIMPGYTKEEQLQKVLKLCGFPSEEYLRKLKPWHETMFKPQHPYKRCIAETFKDFPPFSLPLIETLLAIDPLERETASAALRNKFFTKKPDASEL